MKHPTAFFAIAFTLIFSASISQAADPVSNPISTFFDRLQKIAASQNGNGPKEEETWATQGRGIGNTNTDDIMRSVALENGASGAANEIFCKFQLRDNDKISLAQKTGKFSQAASLALIRAAYVAACSLNGVGAPIAIAKDDVGHLLAVSSINYSRDGILTDDATLHAKYAVALLKLNEKANEAIISDLESIYWPKGPISEAQAFAAMTAKDAVTKYKDNTFAFKRTYSNKTLQIKGRVERITGSDKGAVLVLDGETKKSSNDKGWQDSVLCDIKNSQAMDDAARISSGASVTIQGIYTAELLPAVALEDCRLIH